MECADAYNDARGAFEAILLAAIFSWLFLTVAFLPKNEERERQQRGRCCSFLVPCLRSLTFCFEPFRPLLERNDDERVAEAARRVGPVAAWGFLCLFVLLQAAPSVALAAGLALFYPECTCEDPADCLKCTFRIDFIPVGSCTGAVVFFAAVASLAGMAFAAKVVRAFGVVRGIAVSFSTVGGGDAFEQEVV